MNTGPMDCIDLVELVTAYLDDVMEADSRARFDLHLLECPGCENYLQQFRITMRTIGQIDEEHLDPVYRDRLLEAFRDWR